MFDLHPAARRMSTLVSGVRDEHLGLPTPCAGWSVADLLSHIHQFSSVFADNARKQPAAPPQGLTQDWRVGIPGALDDLAGSWADESAWRGRVSAGGIEMPAADNALVAVEELTVHGWDLARATGQDPDIAEEALDRVDEFIELFAAQIDSGQGPFGPAVSAPEGASRLERVVAMTGRDPRWTPSR